MSSVGGPFRIPRPTTPWAGLLLAPVLLLTACSGGDSATIAPSTGTATSSPPGTALETPTQDAATPDPVQTEPTSDPVSGEPSSDATTASAAPAKADGTATLVFSGEVLLHQTLIDTALRNGGGRDYLFKPMFDGIKDLISSADLAVCHLELPVIPPGQGMEPRYATPPQVMRALDYAGFDRCDTASNHILDRGAAGIDATLDDMTKYGLTQAGIARTAAGQAPKVLDVGGFKVAHLAYTEVPGKAAPAGQPWRVSMAVKSRIVADVRAARAKGAEYVVVSMHDADELHYEPTANQRSWDEWVIDVAGADLVVGTGSHVPEPVEAHGRGQILYGLGNLINWRPNARDSVIARVTLSRGSDGSVVASTAELIPTFTDARLGYQVLDVRESAAKAQADALVRSDLAASLARVRPHVGRWIAQS